MTARDPYFLGIDAGTSVCTAVVMDGRGHVVARRSHPITSHHPAPGRVEQDPGELVRAVLDVTVPLLDRFPVEAAGLDNQGESFLVWDRASGRPLTPSITWQDHRGDVVCAELSPRVDADWLRGRTGLLLDSYFSAPKLARVFRDDPALLQRARNGEVCFGTTDSYLVHALGEDQPHVTDASTASRTLMMNLRSLQWDPELLVLFGIPGNMLPRIIPTTSDAGVLRLGRHRVPLRAMVVDQQAALFAQACVRPGQVKCTLGTGAFVLLNTGDAPRVSRHGVLSTLAWDLGEARAYALDGGVFSVGATVQWLVELGMLRSADEASDVAGSGRDGSVVMVPSLAGLAAPRWMTNARGAVMGMTRDTMGADIVRAALVGIACEIHDVVRAMEADSGAPIASLRVDGGPSRNTFLVQALADLIQVEIAVADDPEATARGSALLAAVGAGRMTVDDVEAGWRAGIRVGPRMDSTTRDRVLAQWESTVASVRAFHA